MAELGLIFLAVFLIEVVALLLLSRRLTQSLSRAFYLITHSHKRTVSLLALFYLPGTIIHELAHVIVAGMMLVRSGEIEFIPEIREDGVKLGSAQIEQTDPLRRALIGFAPVLVGISLIVGSVYYFLNVLPNFAQLSFWMFLILFYILFEVGNTMFSSPKDLEGTAEILAIFAAILVGLYLAGFLHPQQVANLIFTSRSIDFLKMVDTFLFIPLATDLALLVLLKLSLGRRI